MPESSRSLSGMGPKLGGRETKGRQAGGCLVNNLWGRVSSLLSSSPLHHRGHPLGHCHHAPQVPHIWGSWWPSLATATVEFAPHSIKSLQSNQARVRLQAVWLIRLARQLRPLLTTGLAVCFLEPSIGRLGSKVRRAWREETVSPRVPCWSLVVELIWVWEGSLEVTRPGIRFGCPDELKSREVKRSLNLRALGRCLRTRVGGGKELGVVETEVSWRSIRFMLRREFECEGRITWRQGFLCPHR